MNTHAHKVTEIQSATTLKDAGKNLHKSPEYAADQKKAIIDFVTPFLDKVRVGPAKLLIATWRQPATTAGGLIKTQKFMEEDKYQGVAGLVLKVGPLAFQDDSKFKFGGFDAKAFDWVTYNPENGRARELRGLHCRIIEDFYVDSIVEDPELFW